MFSLKVSSCNIWGEGLNQPFLRKDQMTIDKKQKRMGDFLQWLEIGFGSTPLDRSRIALFFGFGGGFLG